MPTADARCWAGLVICDQCSRLIEESCSIFNELCDRTLCVRCQDKWEREHCVQCGRPHRGGTVCEACYQEIRA